MIPRYYEVGLSDEDEEAYLIGQREATKAIVEWLVNTNRADDERARVAIAIQRKFDA